MNIMFLAAGEGQRLRPFTNILPKPAMPLLNIPLAAYTLWPALELNPDKIVVNTYHLPEKVKELYSKLLNPHNRSAIFSDESDGLLASGGGIRKAFPQLKSELGYFMVLNADEVILGQRPDYLQDFISFYKEKGEPLAALLTTDHPGVGTEFGGAWVNSMDEVVEFNKKRPTHGQLTGLELQGRHFIGAMILSNKIINYIPQTGASNILYDALMKGMALGEKVYSYNLKVDWYETGSPLHFWQASMKLAGKPPEPLLQFIFNMAKTSRSQVLKMTDDELQKSFGGTVIVGDSVIIGKGCRVENSVLLPGASIAKNQIIENEIYYSNEIRWKKS